MRALTDAVIDVLRDGPLTVGDGIGNTKRDGTGQALVPPFVVVEPLIQTRDGSFADPFSDVEQWVQATCEGTTREQSEWLADRVEELLGDSDLIVTDLARTASPRDDTTAAPPRFKTFIRARLRAHA